MSESLAAVRALPDPIGEVAERRILPNGLLVQRVRSPLGLIFMIFEARPNVAIEAFSLALKSGNALILRGGKECMETTSVLYELIANALTHAGLPPECLWGITNPDRTLTLELLKARSFIDVVVPRGGETLIEFVVEHSRIPIIKNDRGLCHVYIHEDADINMTLDLVDNAKTQRPGVCNSMETLLVHERVATALLPVLHSRISSAERGHPVEWRICQKGTKTLMERDRVILACEKDYDTEHLDYILNCKVVGSLDEAIAHIEAHGSRHSEAIVTRSESTARQFQSRVDAAAVYWNASTRFTDGYQLGLGGELGISTQKLHVRGPVGLRELTSLRWLVDGHGQIRT
jgi:glutamate-5-semialdehyde dehydrogenase